MNGRPIAIILSVVLFALSVGAITTLDNEPSNDEVQFHSFQEFGLIATSMNLSVGSEKIIVPNSYFYLEGAEYAIDNPSVASISTKAGYCTVSGISPGNATVTASYEKSDGEKSTTTCSINVVDGPLSEEKRFYNFNSENIDYAVTKGDDFEKGYLGLSFTYMGYAVITMPTYKEIPFLKGTGNYFDDRYCADLTVKKDDGTVIIDDKRILINQPISFDIAEYGYGTYKIEVELLNHEVGRLEPCISGSFEYCEGDGTVDANYSFIRNQNWEYRGEKYSVSFEIPYYDYLMYHFELSSMIKYYEEAPGGLYSNIIFDGYAPMAKMVAARNPYCTSILAELKDAYATTNDNPDYTSADFANFILGYVQICYVYGFESNLYFDGQETPGKDYWSSVPETLWAGMGDCEDTSILAASLFREAGFKAGVFIIPGHAMAAVAIPDYDENLIETESDMGIMVREIDGIKYYGCETTNEWFSYVGLGYTSFPGSTEDEYIDTTTVDLVAFCEI